MKALIDSVKTHFSYEEALMHKNGYPDAGDHKLHHLNLVETLASYDLQLKSNAQINLQFLLESLHTWLLQHILDSDKQLGEFLHKRGVD